MRYRTALCLLCLCSINAFAQHISKSDRDLAQQMLRNVSLDVKKYYYDPKIHGIDWDAKVRQAQEDINKADSMDGAVSEIAALLDSLNDSHTVLILPPRNYDQWYGFRMRMFGDRCYVTQVRKNSDAEKKGLKPGDQVLAINGLAPTRKSLWRIKYIFEYLRPQPGLWLGLAGEGGQTRKINVMAKLEPSPVTRYRLHQGINEMVHDWTNEYLLLEPEYFEKGDGFLAVRIPAFELSAQGIDLVLDKMRKHRGVVLDLRGNPGGFEKTLSRLAGGMFENNLKLFDVVERDSTKTISADGRHHDAFTGRLVVLIDNQSASASELFARIIQLEKRGFVMGEHSPGMVMAAKSYGHEVAVDTDNFYGAEISVGDAIMTDGKSLEHVGVDPDITVIPTAQDIASHRDPVMAKAAGLLGTKITPEEAGSMFPEKDEKY
ncbi:MAG TPA: S41 family peptidase [Terriglobales bacterium]|nr:S41 family peptidase [Terriglobales bacterium]